MMFYIQGGQFVQKWKKYFLFTNPSTIFLGIYIHQDHRELPIKADYIGHNHPTSLNDIHVHTKEIDDADSVLLMEYGG